MKGLFKLHVDLYYSALFGLFVADTEQIERLRKDRINVHWGEVSGKHSDENCPIEGNEITLVTTDETVIKMVQANNLEFGFNPLDEYYGGGYDDLPEVEDFEWEECSILSVIEYKLTGKLPE